MRNVSFYNVIMSNFFLIMAAIPCHVFPYKDLCNSLIVYTMNNASPLPSTI